MSFHASLYELVTPSKVQSLAAEWDEPEVNIDKTLRAGAGSLLSALADQSGDQEVMTATITLAKQVVGATVTPLEAGGGLAEMLLGERKFAAAEFLGSRMQLRPASAAPLLRAAAALLLEWLGERVEAHGLNAAALSHMLVQNQPRLRALAPEGWTAAIAVERHPASSALLHPMLVPIVVGALAVMGVFIWYAMYGRPTLG